MTKENPKIKSYFNQIDAKVKKLPLTREEHDELKQLLNACYVGIQTEYSNLEKRFDGQKEQ